MSCQSNGVILFWHLPHSLSINFQSRCRSAFVGHHLLNGMECENNLTITRVKCVRSLQLSCAWIFKLEQTHTHSLTNRTLSMRNKWWQLNFRLYASVNVLFVLHKFIYKTKHTTVDPYSVFREHFHDKWKQSISKFFTSNASTRLLYMKFLWKNELQWQVCVKCHGQL